MKELDKLEAYLKEKGFVYERVDRDYKHDVHNKHQIIVYKDGKRIWDAICQWGSYGYSQGLLEIYGSIVFEEDGDSVRGWLTAEEVIERIEKND